MPITTHPDIVKEGPVEIVADPLLDGRLRAIAVEQLGYLRTVQLRECGVTQAEVERRIRAGWWRRAARGVIDVAVEPPHEHSIAMQKVRGAVLVLAAFGPEAIAVGPTALNLYGVWGVPASRPPQIALPRASGRLSRPGLVCRRFEAGVVPRLVHGMRAVPPVVALAQFMCEGNAWLALGVIDSAINRGVIQPREVRDVREAVRGRRGCVRLAEIWEYVDGRHDSPPETYSSFFLRATDLEPTDVQIEIRDSAGVLVARADGGFEFDDGSWLFTEIDGSEYHPLGNADDPARDARVISVLDDQWIRAEILRFTPDDIGVDGAQIPALRERLRGRTWRAPDPTKRVGALLVDRRGNPLVPGRARGV